MKFKEKLQKLFEEYLATLDDTDKDEYYNTDKGIANSVLKILWRGLKSATPNHELGGYLLNVGGL